MPQSFRNVIYKVCVIVIWCASIVTSSMPETGYYTGYNNELYMRWNLTRSDEFDDGRAGTVSMLAQRLVAPEYKFYANNVKYSRGGWPWYSLNFDTDNADLKKFAKMLCHGTGDWRSLSYGSHWIDGLGMKLNKE